MPVTDRLKQASRVVRTLHQGAVTALLAFVLVVPILGVPAATVAPWIAGAVAGLTAVAKVYNVLFPAEPDLDEDPLN